MAYLMGLVFTGFTLVFLYIGAPFSACLTGTAAVITLWGALKKT